MSSTMRREPLIAVAIIALGFLGVKGFHLYQGMNLDRGVYFAKVDVACNQAGRAMASCAKATQALSHNPQMIATLEGSTMLQEVSQNFMSASQQIQSITEVPYGCGNIQDDLTKLATSCEQLANDFRTAPEGIGSAAEHIKAVSWATIEVQQHLSEARSVSSG